MERSLAQLDDEGSFPTFGEAMGIEGFEGFVGMGNQLDNYTAMWMIQSVDSEHFFDKDEYTIGARYDVGRREPIEGDAVTRAFRSGWEDGNYWCGYRVVLKPLLLVIGIRGVRLLTLLVVFASLVWALVRIKQTIGGAECLLLLVSIFSINPLNTIIDLDQAPDLIQALLSTVFVLWMLRKGVPSRRIFASFLAFGAVEAFINCLIMPLVTLGIPLAAVVLYKMKDGGPWKETLWFSFRSCIAWAVGYAASFASVWIISSPFRGISWLEGVQGAIDMFLWRAGAQEESLARTLFNSVQANVSMSVPVVWALMLIVACALVSTCREAGTLSPLSGNVALLCVGMLPFVWILVLSNHSMNHYWMVHDIFMITVWCLSCAIYYLVTTPYGKVTGEHVRL